jgi:hypothetical protein
MKYTLLVSAAVAAILGIGPTSSVHAGEVIMPNGMQLQGISLNGMSLQGTSLNGMSLQGISLNGVIATGVAPNWVTAKKVTRSQTLTDPKVEVVGIKLPPS